MRWSYGSAIFFSFIASFPGFVYSQEVTAKKNVSVEDLGMCRIKATQVKGLFGPICKGIVSSPEFRRACEGIRKEDRLKCDGSDHLDGAGRLGKNQLLEKCTAKIIEGFTGSTQEKIVVGAMKKAKEVDSWAAKNQRKAVKSLTGSTPEEIAYWIAKKKGIARQFLGLSGAQKSSSATQSEISSFVASVGGSTSPAPVASAEDLPVTTDSSAYAAATASDPSQVEYWAGMAINPEFWIALVDVYQEWATEIGKTDIREFGGLFCMTPQAQDAAICEAIGDWGILPAGGVALKGALSGTKIVASGAKAVALKSKDAVADFGKKIVRALHEMRMRAVLGKSTSAKAAKSRK